MKRLFGRREGEPPGRDAREPERPVAFARGWSTLADLTARERAPTAQAAADVPPERCRYCGRDFGSAEGATSHLNELTRAGMLLDHIAIHGPPGMF